MNLLLVAQLLEDADLGTKAETIFINQIPIECPAGILLRNRLQGTKIDYEILGYYRAKFQLIVRSGDYLAGEALIDAAIQTLTSLTATKIGDMNVRYMRPCYEAVVFPLSKGNLLEFSTEFDVVYDNGA